MKEELLKSVLHNSLRIGVPRYRLIMNLFGDEGEGGEGEGNETEPQEPNEPQEPKNGDNGEGEGKKQKSTISMTESQLKDRLERERKKATEQANENISKIVAEALKKHDEEAKKQANFEKMTEEERREALLQEREEKLKEDESKLQKQIEEINVSNAKNTIMSNYDKDQLPRRDLFEPVAEFMARLDDDSKVYSAIKSIIEDTKKSMMKEAMKQNPPSNGDSSGSTFKSTKFAHDINANYNSNTNDGSVPWGSKNY